MLSAFILNPPRAVVSVKASNDQPLQMAALRNE
jgi:hypothetical protein